VTLTPADRTRLLKAVTAARRIIEDDFAASAEGRFGLRRPDRIDPEEALTLPPAALAARRQLVHILEHLGLAEGNGAGPVGRLLREATFTTLNRLVAIRVAEAIDLLPPALVEGRRSRGFTELLELFPLLRDDDTGGYAAFLRMCADELGRDAPVLFDPRNPLLDLELSPPALDKLTDIFADTALVGVWAEPDAFGWTYQFFKTSEEDDRTGVPAPRTSEELALRNQFFTPRYVVDFLVHNSLGRRLLEAEPTSTLAEHLTMLVARPTARGARLELDEVRVLDPAVGSGHFLLGCYDVLEQAWSLQGVEQSQAAARIVPALWGVDIDPRCAQVAAAAVALRARRRCREGDLPAPKIVTARALPDDPAAWSGALAGLSPPEQDLVGRIREVLRQAPVLGSLLKVEQALATEIRTVSPAADFDDARLFAPIARDAFGQAEGRILDALQRAAADAGATVAERLIAAEAGDAIGFIEAMRQTYDAVLMNPPFGEPVEATKGWLKAAYPWLPNRTHDLLAAFVGRGLELCHEEGYLGAITSRAGMFLTTFERWRTEVLLGHRLVTLADLGYGVMQGAMVEAAAYVVGAGKHRPDDEAVFVRLVKEADKADGLARTVAELKADGASSLAQVVRQDEFAAIPGSPLAHWVVPPVRALFSALPAIEGKGAEVRQGLATANDGRFVRAFWEVDPARVARSREETRRGRPWVPFAKGGEYSPLYGDIHLVVDWGEDGRALRDTGSAPRIQNEAYYFRPGLTWPLRTQAGFNPRALPEGCAFGHKGPAAFAVSGRSPELVLGWLTSRLADALIEITAHFGSYEVGLVQRLPWIAPAFDAEAEHAVARATTEAASVRARMDEGDETTRRFVCPEALRVPGATLAARAAARQAEQNLRLAGAIERTYEVERTIHSALDLDNEAEAYLDEEYGPHPASYPAKPLADEGELVRLSAMPLDAVIRETLTTRGGSRVIATKSYFLDRRLEIFSHLAGRHPSMVAEAWGRLGLLPPGEPAQSARDLVSYLMGAALGRWDLRIGRDPNLAPRQPGLFDPVPVCSPGTLVGADGLPLVAPPPGYPIELPPLPLLLDEEGHPWDIEARLRGAAAAVVDDADAILEEVERILGQPLRSYLRRPFWADHLGRYSKSRRKAPIYWYLSVPSRAWGCWIYAPRLAREVVYAVGREARRRLHLAGETVERCRAEQTRASGKALARLDKELTATERLGDELRAFAAEAERVAGLGWEPDLGDGMVLCAAPLAGLFPAWPEAAKERAKLKDGEYRWAAVTRWAEAL
jgi:hypothetical protein